MKQKISKNKSKSKSPLLLIILDGWGSSNAWGGNAIAVADTPNLDKMYENYPHTLLRASGEAVGVVKGEAGSSEVGHINIGAGYVVKQKLTLIKESIDNKTFFDNPILKEISSRLMQNPTQSLHIMGLASEGGVHSHLDHLLALLDFTSQNKLKSPYLHLFTDGRDADIMSAQYFVDKVQQKISDTNIGQIASLSGRYYAMDRNNHWDRTKLVYELLTEGHSPEVESPEIAIKSAYAEGITDEFMVPTKIKDSFQPIKDNDIIIFFNFRPDRARQLTECLCEADFSGFKREKVLQNLYLSTFVQYESSLSTKAIFPKVEVTNPLARVLSDQGLSQFHIAETEKYAHVTYFLNGGMEKPFPNESRVMIPSPKVATYDLDPSMSANEITQEIIKTYSKSKFDVGIINFANADMVGHSGNLEATIGAVEVVDYNLGILKDYFVDKLGGTLVITADHGNAEQEVNSVTAKPDTEHTTNPVPLLIIRKNLHPKLKSIGALCNVAPTILDLLKLKKPVEMSGKSLIEDK